MINVSDNLKNAVINEEKPKTLRIYRMCTTEIDYFNLCHNNRFAGSEITYGDSAPQNDFVHLDLSDYFDISSVNREYFKGASGLFVSLELSMSWCELKKINGGQWIDTDTPIKARVGFTIHDTNSASVLTKYGYANSSSWWNRAWGNPFHGFPISATCLFESNTLDSWVIDEIFLDVYFDDSLYNGLIYTATIYKPIIHVRTTDGWASVSKLDNQYDREDYLKREFTTINNSNIVSETFGFEESVCSADRLKLGGCETKKVEIQTFDDTNNYLETNVRFSLGINSKGYFGFEKMIPCKVEKTSRGGTICKRITAYDRLDRLSANAYAWYTQYMFGMNLIRATQYRNYQFDYERQIFATYWNLAKSFGIEREGEFESAYCQYCFDYPLTTFSNDYKFNNDYFNQETASTKTVYCVNFQFNKTTFDSYGNFKAMQFKHTDFVAGQGRDWYTEDFDSLGRGAFEIGSIMVEFYDSNEAILGSFLLDDGDIVLPPVGWQDVKVIIPSCWDNNGGSKTWITTRVAIFGVSFNYYDPYDIVNATAPLPYYSYIWRKPSLANIFTADSSITARDVMRSLMEMCGCFYRLSRDGKPQFIYAQEHGLYPSNDLYPADTLFPKKSGEMTMPTSYYISAEFAEFQVEKFGGVQVVVRTKDNTGAVVRWEYWEDDSSDSAYLIDDNIFLCAEEFLYDPQNTGNIDTLLENIFHCLDNLQYTPFTAETIGTPFLESGDRFTLLTQTDGFESFIFDRKLKGIQALKDHYEARGIAKTPRVKNFEWQS